MTLSHYAKKTVKLPDKFTLQELKKMIKLCQTMGAFCPQK